MGLNIIGAGPQRVKVSCTFRPVMTSFSDRCRHPAGLGASASSGAAGHHQPWLATADCGWSLSKANWRTQWLVSSRQQETHEWMEVSWWINLKVNWFTYVFEWMNLKTNNDVHLYYCYYFEPMRWALYFALQYVIVRSIKNFSRPIYAFVIIQHHRILQKWMTQVL